MESVRLADGRMLSARRWTAGTRRIVVLHGLLDSSESWACLYQRLACSGVALDLPGFGSSDPPQRGSIAAYARDVADGLEKLGVERFTLVGHSLGGAVATALAELIPDRVASLVLLAPAGFGRLHLAEAVSAPGVRTIVRAALPLALSSRFAVSAGYLTMVTSGRLPDQDLVDRVTARGPALVAGAREGTRAVVDAGRSREAFYRRRVRYSGPVFALWGDQDRLVPPSHRHAVRAAFPDAQIDLWAGMGHHPLHERFDALTALIDQAAAAADPCPSLRRLRRAAAARK